MTATVTLFHAPGCSLCGRVRDQLTALRAELGFEYDEVDISSDESLERRYREWLPVVEVGGVRAFVYYLDEAAFRRRIAAADGVAGPE